MRILIGIVAVTFLSVAATVHAQMKPSFICAKVRTNAEDAICNDKALTADAVLIEQQLAKLRKALDPETVKALEQDQQNFIVARDQGFGHPQKGLTSVEWLTKLLHKRVDFLNNINPMASKKEFSPWGEVGYWGNFSGGLDIQIVGKDEFKVGNKSGNPIYKIRLHSEGPQSDKWVCDFEGLGQVDLDHGDLIFDDSVVGLFLIRRIGSGLIAKEFTKLDTKTNGNSPYCGLNGSVNGTYFPLTRSALSWWATKDVSRSELQLPDEFTIRSSDWMDKTISRNDSVAATVTITRMIPSNLYTLAFRVDPKVWDGKLGAGIYSADDLGMFMTCVSAFVSNRSGGNFFRWNHQDEKIKPVSTFYLLVSKSATDPVISADQGDYNPAILGIRWDKDAAIENAQLQEICPLYFPNYPK